MTERPGPDQPGDRHRDRRFGIVPGEDEHDPTGVRVILSSLGDPGPMPHDLVQRISASLAQEHARRAQDTGLATVHSLTDATPRRTTFGQRLPSIAIAASIVVLAGAVVLGVLTMYGGSNDFAGGDSGAMMASSDAADESGAMDGSLDSTEEAAPEAAAPSRQGSDTGGGAKVQVLLFATGRDLSDANFEAEADPMQMITSSVWDQAAEELLASSTVGTSAGAADCLMTIVDAPQAEVAARIAMIDSVSYSGTPAALILVTDDLPSDDADQATGSAGPMTAYVVPLDCRREHAVTLREPVHVG